MSQLKSLAAVEDSLNGWLKPKVFGASWDNIGLLIGSGKYDKKEDKVITGILVCNDLKPKVLEEAIKKNANLVIAYHPPIFSGMKTIAYGSWKEQLIAKCLFNDISIYSPHTTLDAVAGGINDAVISALGEFGSDSSKAIIPSPIIDSESTGLLYESSAQNVSQLIQSIKLSKFDNVAVELDSSGDKAKLGVYAKSAFIKELQEIKDIAKATGIPEFINGKEATPPPFGDGRLLKFSKPVDFSRVVDAVKRNLGLDHVQIVYAGKAEVSSVAVCVGSGSSLLVGVAADVYITGEMSHHAQLDCLYGSSSVILCNHCSSERHYLEKLARIVRMLTGVEVFVSEEDRSPLTLSN